MNEVSYSAHISNGKSAINSKGKLSGVAKHNLRKYRSKGYDRENILQNRLRETANIQMLIHYGVFVRDKQKGKNHDLTVAEYKVQQETKRLEMVAENLDEKQDMLYDASLRLEQTEKEVSEAERHLSDTKMELAETEKDLIQIKTESRETKQKLMDFQCAG